MSSTTKVAIAGASGVTGSSIMRALLASPETFEVTMLVRPTSVGKHEYAEFVECGAVMKPVDLGNISDTVIQALTGMDVVISCLTLRAFNEEMNLVEAATAAGVGRYVPSFFGPSCPPRGVMLLRERKEDILDHIKRLYLPYTVIDFGWWYQLSLPPLPSGKVQARFEMCTAQILGDGNTPWALTDNRDIGKYVARVIADPRTLHKSVFGYSGVWSQNAVWDALEKSRASLYPGIMYLYEKELLALISEGQAEMANPAIMLQVAMAQYKYSLGIRGDNTPEHAKYLGYLDAKELYPDVESTPLEAFIRDAVEGRAKPAYS
ncbi:hypothetical protein F5144DRAFT_477670 [Chaetomium tenue]|uniref:Uncharacterized protein n=1 Tax=Chaetomium tenue TaxID=1854479 RepID=A0ACB7PS77_9PEZI|nr:hypothetical protein F5144DRAFT_477670 [Chaetomium globosum]